MHKKSESENKMDSNKKQIKVTVRGESENPTKINLTSGKFKMVIDEPKGLGGTDEGPSPVQVLLMSLAGCLNVTGHEVARQRGMKLNGMKVQIEGVMNPCTFIGCSFEERAGFQTIKVTVNPDVEGATQEEIDGWLEETEKRCPVTDNIRATTEIIVEAKQLEEPVGK
jgi:uncharacterized OsmC-like protein